MLTSAPEVVAYADWGVANLNVLPFCYAKHTGSRGYEEKAVIPKHTIHSFE